MTPIGDKTVFIAWYEDEDELDYMVFSNLHAAQIFLWEQYMNTIEDASESIIDQWDSLTMDREIPSIGWIETVKLIDEMGVKLKGYF